MSQIVRGNIDPEQFKAIRRQGDSSVVQMAGSGVKTSGHLLVYDANGNAVDGGAPGSGGGTVTNSGTLTADLPIFGAGTTVVKAGTKTGTTDEVVTSDGSVNNGYPLLYNASGDVVARQPRGNTTVAQLADSTTNPTNGHVAVFDANGNVKDGGAPATIGGTVPTTGWTAHNSIIWNDFLTPKVLGAFISDSGSQNWRFLTQSLGGNSTYTFIASMLVPIFSGVNSQTAGFYVYDGTKLIGFELLAQSGATAKLRVERLNSATSDNSTVAGPTVNLVTQMVWTVKIVKDGSHRTFSYYTAGAYTQFYQEANTAWLTETDIGVGGISNSNNAAAAVSFQLIDWSLVAP